MQVRLLHLIKINYLILQLLKLSHEEPVLLLSASGPTYNIVASVLKQGCSGQAVVDAFEVIINLFQHIAELNHLTFHVYWLDALITFIQHHRDAAECLLTVGLSYLLLILFGLDQSLATAPEARAWTKLPWRLLLYLKCRLLRGLLLMKCELLVRPHMMALIAV